MVGDHMRIPAVVCFSFIYFVFFCETFQACVATYAGFQFRPNAGGLALSPKELSPKETIYLKTFQSAILKRSPAKLFICYRPVNVGSAVEG